MGRGFLRPAPRHLRLRPVGRARAEPVAGARSLRGQAAVLLPDRRRRAVRLGTQGDLRQPRGQPGARRQRHRRAVRPDHRADSRPRPAQGPAPGPAGPGAALRPQCVRELVYWALRAERHEEGAEDSAERAGQLLREAVAEQLVADVPLGSLLSGGLDSSAISAFAVAALDGDARRLPTFSVDFPAKAAASSRRPGKAAGTNPMRSWRRTSSVRRTVPCWSPRKRCWNRTRRCSRPATCPAGASWTPRSTCCPPGPRAHHGGTVGRVGRRGVRRLPVLPRPGRPRTRRLPWLAGKSGPWQLLRREVAERVAAPEYIRARYREALAEVPRLDGEDAAQRRQREVAYLALSRWLPAMLERKDRMSMAVGLEVRVRSATTAWWSTYGTCPGR